MRDKFDYELGIVLGAARYRINLEAWARSLYNNRTPSSSFPPHHLLRKWCSNICCNKYCIFSCTFHSFGSVSIEWVLQLNNGIHSPIIHYYMLYFNTHHVIVWWSWFITSMYNDAGNQSNFLILVCFFITIVIIIGTLSMQCFSIP